MAKIKSAWEIALERTENIQIDREKLKKDENIKKARLCAGAYLNDEENKIGDGYFVTATKHRKKLAGFVDYNGKEIEIIPNYLNGASDNDK